MKTRYEFKGIAVYLVEAVDVHEAKRILKDLYPDMEWEPLRKIEVTEYPREKS